jgi:hypothetical protein
MASTKDLKAKLADIDTWLSSGAKSVTVDGVTVSIDPAQLKMERARIERLLKTSGRKPPAYRVNMGG